MLRIHHPSGSIVLRSHRIWSLDDFIGMETSNDVKNQEIDQWNKKLSLLQAMKLPFKMLIISKFYIHICNTVTSRYERYVKLLISAPIQCWLQKFPRMQCRLEWVMSVHTIYFQPWLVKQLKWAANKCMMDEVIPWTVEVMTEFGSNFANLMFYTWYGKK